jgi:hypothetical protein
MSDQDPTHPVVHPRVDGRPRAARWSPSALRRLLRRPILYWMLALSLALGTGLIVSAATARARALESAFGERTSVFVTTSRIRAGMPLTNATQTRDFPLSLVPEDAVNEVDVGDVAAHTITAGSVLTSADISTRGSITTAQVSIPVPISPTTPPVHPGAQVLLVVNADPFNGLEPQLIPGTVSDITDQQVVVAINRADLPTASAALSSGTATLAVTAG